MGKSETVSMLINHGANVEDRDYDGQTALTVACSQGYTEVAEILLEKGAIINIQSNVRI